MSESGFTPDSVLKMLRASQLAGNAPLPPRGDNVYETVTIVLNHLRRVWRLPEREGPLRRIASAIQTLAELLPIVRADCETELNMAQHFHETWPDVADPKKLECARGDLDARDALQAAVAEAMTRGLPIAPIEVLAPPLDSETSMMVHLDELLPRILPCRHVAERRRFIAEVVRRITGKALTEAQVRDRIRKSPLNMGNA